MITTNKVVKGSLWLTSIRVFQQLSGFIVNIILARLLLPKDFGLAALVFVVLGFVQIITNIGFGNSIIAFEKVTQEQLSSLFWINLFTSLFSFFIVYFSAGLAASFYNNESLVHLIHFISFSILVTPFHFINRRLLEKEIEFKTLTKVDITSNLLSSIAAIVSAYLGAGVYSLIILSFSQNIFYLITLNIVNPWKPSFIFKWNSIKSMVFYSFRYKGGVGTNYIERNVDYMILGKIYSAGILGIYSFAYNIMYFPIKRISSIFTDVLFPSFSAVQENLQKVRTGYLKSIQLIAIITFPLMTIISLYCGTIIPFVFGNKWVAAVPIVSILSFAGAIQSIDQIPGSIFNAVKKPEINFYTGIFRTIITIVAIIIGSLISFTFLAFLLVLSKLLFFLINCFLLKKFIELKYISIFKSLKGPILASIVILIIRYLSKNLLHLNLSEIVLLIISLIFSAAIIYVINKKDLVFVISKIKS